MAEATLAVYESVVSGTDVWPRAHHPPPTR
jgi:hypothetical protein